MQDFGKVLESLDTHLKQEGVPLRFRPLECFKKIYGVIKDEPQRSSAFDPINLWFANRYGNDSLWDGILARVPIIFRGELYLAAIPFTIQDTSVRVTDLLEGFDADKAPPISHEEFKLLARRLNSASECHNSLYTLHVDNLELGETERDLTVRALFDLEHAATSLKTSGDTQNSIFHSQQAAEKFLKAGILRADPKVSQRELQRIGHSLTKSFDSLLAKMNRYKWLEQSVRLVHAAAPSMEIRYSRVPRTMEQAISCYFASVTLCGALARYWLLDIARGSTSASFAEGKFYVDSPSPDLPRRRYKCTSVAETEVTLTVFMHTPPDGLALVEMTLDPEIASFYLEITSKDQSVKLEQEFAWFREKCNLSVDPKTVDANIERGPETYSASFIRRTRLR